MELKLFRMTTIRDLKKQFSMQFPFLKIEFFGEEHSPKQSWQMHQKLDDQLTLAEINGVCKEGNFSFASSSTVAEFEQRLQNEFGLPVQVFRKAADLWIEAVQAEKLTLDQQNKMGEAASKPVRFNMNSLFL